MTDLKEINFGMNKYCGPAFLSAITGKDTDECANILSEISGKRNITYTEVGHLIKAMERLRFKAEKQKLFSYSLYGNLTHFVKQDGMYMIIVPRHVVGVQIKEGQIYLVDNHTTHPIDAAASARLTQRVEQAYKIVPKPSKKLIRTEISVEDNGGYLDIKAHEIYELEEDNEIINLGYVRIRSDKELKEILESLHRSEKEIRES
jgi:hypothetical protein